MSKHPWIILSAVAAAALPWAACSSSNGNGTTGTGGHTTTTTHTTSNSTTTTTPDSLAACDAPATPPSTGSCYTPPKHPPPASCTAGSDGGTPEAGGGDGGGEGGAFSCGSSIPMANACGMCVESSCCAELTACNAIPYCMTCVTDPNADQTKCGMDPIKTALAAIGTCQTTCCQDICSPPCDPVGNGGCNVANEEACDINFNSGGYTCYATPMGSGICEACDEMAGPYCAGGMTCLSDGSCAAFCCDDKDCGTGTCDKTMIANETVVGVCLHK